MTEETTNPVGRPRADRLVKVLLKRGYVPAGTKPEADGTYVKNIPGEEISLPVDEAKRICKAEIAEAVID